MAKTESDFFDNCPRAFVPGIKHWFTEYLIPYRPDAIDWDIMCSFLIKDSDSYHYPPLCELDKVKSYIKGLATFKKDAFKGR